MNRSLPENLRQCRERPGSDEGHVAGLVATVLDPALKTAGIEADLQSLAEGCPAALAPWRYLADEGFQGNLAHYTSLDNSNLARVLATRRGIPISLGVVLIRVARVAGRRAAGINFPGHFLVQVDDVLVDPFVMETVDPAPLVEQLPPPTRLLPRERLFARATPLAVGLRMLNNIKLIFSQQAAWHRTLDVLDAQLQLAPEQPSLHLERGDVWRRLGALAAARESWQQVLELTDTLSPEEAAPVDPEALRRAARARLNEAGDAGDVVH